MKFPKRLRHRGKGKVLATIYKLPDSYRLYWRARVDGKPRSMFKDFSLYGAAKKEGDKVVDGLAKGSQSTALSPGQASSALAALERLHRHYVATGNQVSLLAGVEQFCDAAEKLSERGLNGRSLSEAVEGFLSGVASVKRKDLAEAVALFIAEREEKTKAKADGKRPNLSPEHHYNTSRWMLQFAKAFPGTAVCDLEAKHLNLFMAQNSEVGSKTRNEKRSMLQMFLKWCAEQEQQYLSRTSRLFESKGLSKEDLDDVDIECYDAAELRLLLDRASRAPVQPKAGEEAEQDYRGLVPMLVLAGLAGLRLKEAMRLSFEGIFRRPEHIEISAQQSKTRSRRLVTVCPSLAAWLEDYRKRTGPVWPKSYDMFHLDFAALRKEVGVTEKRNGLRHSYISAHYAAHSDEGLTAALAGNSPAMIHQHYKGLLTKAEGEAWFAVAPARPANVIQLTQTKGAKV